MDNKVIGNISEYAKLFSAKKFIESGFIAVRESDGIAITVSKADLNNIDENSVVFVNDKNIESYEGNFRAAAVILFCAIRQDKTAEAAAIVDSDAILEYSNKRKPLQPVMDNVAKLLGVTVKCASKNVAAEIVTSLSGYRNACFMPDAGAVVKARSLKELALAVDVLDKACHAEMLAENKGGTQHLNPVNALLEQVAYRFTTRSEYSVKPSDKLQDNAQTASENNKAEEVSENPIENIDNNQTGETNTNHTEDDGNSQRDEVPEVAETNSVEEGNSNSQSNEVAETNSVEEDNSNSQSNEVAEVVRSISVEGGKVVSLACPRYVTAVCAIGKPMTVAGEYVEKLGEEINCLPSKMILSDKAFEKITALMGDLNICFMAQHGVIVKADSEQELLDTVKLVEAASKAYFETNSVSENESSAQEQE